MTATAGSATPDDGRLVLVRHGRTPWAHEGRHTGLSDVPLDDVGREQAAALPPLLAGVVGPRALVLCSPLVRATETAELAGLSPYEVEPDLVEWDYGGYEGMTTPQIREQTGGFWEVFSSGVVPGDADHPGESLEDVAVRARRVLERVRPELETRDVVLVGHGHFTRVLASAWLEVDPGAGARLLLDPAAVCVMDSHHEVPAIRHWNLSPALVASISS